MADKINGYGRNGVDITSSRTRAAARSEGAKESRPAESTRGDDAVRLTDTATNLKQIEARLAQVPDVDRARVEAARQRIESGNYKVDAGRVAERLMQFEQDLA